MARLEQDFTGQLSDLEYTPRKTIAPGRYVAMIVKCDYEASKKNPRNFNLIPTFKILDGEYRGEEIKQWLCVRHDNKTTQDIAVSKKARLGVILCGTPNPADTNLLLNKPLIIETDTEANDYINKEGVTVQSTNNVIKNYHPERGEFKDLIAASKKPNAPTPPIAHSTITNSAGGVVNTTSIYDANFDEVPF